MDSYSVQAVLSVKDKNFTSTMNSASSTLSGLNTSTQKASSGVGALGTAFAVAQTVVSGACNVIKSSVSAAVDRVDTLNQYPKIMEQMGFSSEAAEVSIEKLTDGIQGLPTSLDSIVSSTQNIAILTGDLDLATDTALALNDAFLASGSSTADAERGLTQYVQMLSSGKVDMQSWKTLQETMGYALSETAKELGITSGNTQELYSALQDGSITFDQFNAAIIECDTCVGGFAESASIACEGIATSWENVKTAVVRGVANMITAWNEAAADNGLPTIQESLQGLQSVCDKVFSAASKAIKGFVNNLDTIVAACTPVVAAIGGLKVVQTVSEHFKKFKQSGKEAADALKNYEERAKSAKQASENLKTAEAALKNAQEKEARASQQVFDAAKKMTNADEKAKTAVENLRKAEEKCSSSAEKNADAEDELAKAEKESKAAAEEAEKATEEYRQAMEALEAAQEQTAATTQMAANAQEQEASAIEGTTLKAIAHNAILAVMSGEMTIAAAAQEALNAAMSANPIGLVTAAISALISVLGVVTTLVKKFSGAEETAYSKSKKLKKEVNELCDSLDESADEMDENINSAKSSSNVISTLAKDVARLANKENRSEAETAALKSSIATLNGEVEGLDLEFDEVTDSLNMTTDAMLAFCKASAKQKEVDAITDAYAQTLLDLDSIEQELAGAQEELQKTQDAMNDAVRAGDDASVSYMITMRNQKNAIEELEEKNEEYVGKKEELEAQLARISEEETQAQIDAYNAQSAALAEKVENDTVTYDDLCEANQATADAMRDAWDSATQDIGILFEALSDETDITVQDMIDNIEESRRVQREWGDNMEELRDRFAKLGLDDAILDQMADLGVEGAGYVAAMADSTNTELAIMVHTWEMYGDDTTNSLFKRWGVAKDEIPSNIYEYITTPIEESLSEQLQNIDWASMGDDVISGFTESLEDTSEVEAAGEALGDAVPEGAESALGISSPSRVMMEVGEYAVEGLALGLEDTSSLTDAGNNIAKAVIDAVTKGLGKADFSGSTDSMWSSIASSAKSGMKQVSSAVMDGMNTASRAMESGFKNMDSTTLSQMKSIASTTDKGFSDVASTTTKQMDGVKNTIQSAMDSCKTYVSNGVSGMKSTFSNGMKDIKSTASSTCSSIVSTFNSLYSGLYSSGANAMAGLQAGLNSRKSSVMSTAKSIANSVTNTINSALKVGSPSRVLEKTGQFAGQGLVNGLKDMLSDVKAVSGQMADTVTDMVFGSFDAPKLAFAGGMDMSANYIFDDAGILDALDDLTGAIDEESRRPIQVTVYSELDGREIAKGTAQYMQDEQDRLQARNSRRQQFSIGG